MKTLYAIGTRVSLTPWAFAHVSIMSSEASWMGFFMYPTLSSRSCAWAEKRPVERARPIAVAAQSPMKRRSSGIDPSSNRAVSWMSAGLDHHTPLPEPRQCGRPPSSGLAAIQVPKHRPFQGRPDARGPAVAAARRLRAIRRWRRRGFFHAGVFLLILYLEA